MTEREIGGTKDALASRNGGNDASHKLVSEALSDMSSSSQSLHNSSKSAEANLPSLTLIDSNGSDSVSRSELKDATLNENLLPSERNGAAFLHRESNFASLSSIDGAPDISEKDLKTFSTQINNVLSKSDSPFNKLLQQTTFRRLDYDSSRTISRRDLQIAMKDKNFTEEERANIESLSKHFDQLSGLESVITVAKLQEAKSHVDNLLSTKLSPSLRAEVNQLEQKMATGDIDGTVEHLKELSLQPDKLNEVVAKLNDDHPYAIFRLSDFDSVSTAEGSSKYVPNQLTINNSPVSAVLPLTKNGGDAYFSDMDFKALPNAPDSLIKAVKDPATLYQDPATW